MQDTAKALITIGVLFLLGLLTDALGRRTKLPRVTLLLVFGFLIGPTGLDFLNPSDGKWFSLVADMALVMIGFPLGEKLALSSLRQHGRFVLWLSVAEVVGTALVVFIGLLVIRVPLDVALLLAGIAPATDPERPRSRTRGSEHVAVGSGDAHSTSLRRGSIVFGTCLLQLLRNSLEKSMEISFFALPSQQGPVRGRFKPTHRPISLSTKVAACVRRFETPTPLNHERPALALSFRSVVWIREYLTSQFSLLMPYEPGLGQGQSQKKASPCSG
ncbi:MAG TPA: cation:proton antiporter [Desulfatiglandales bacterium]|nr:cation:proton antiporter [Desulfatiglandales bacterium]